MNELLETLLKLQAIEFGETVADDPEVALTRLRAKVPPQILGHYDRLVARGKKGVALVRDQVCTGCHMRVPIGVVTTLMHGKDIQLCGNCGRYLYLAEPLKADTAEPVGRLIPAKKRRKPKKPLQTA